MSMLSKDKNASVRLEKKISIQDKIKRFIRSHRYNMMFILILFAFFAFFTLLFYITPPVESGQYYNHLSGFYNYLSYFYIIGFI